MYHAVQFIGLRVPGFSRLVSKKTSVWDSGGFRLLVAYDFFIAGSFVFQWHLMSMPEVSPSSGMV